MTQATNDKRKGPAGDTELQVTEPSGLLPFLLHNLTGRSRNNVKSLLTHREVLVDGRVVTQYDHPLKPGQTVRIVRSVSRKEKPERLPQILYEDSELLVIDKPAGLLSVATDTEKQNTAYHMLTDYVRGAGSRGRLFVVHRLDRDTSGVLLFAKNERLKLALQESWDSLVSRRGYVAVVEGQLREKSGRVRSWLKQTSTLLVYSGRTPGDGQEAITNYRVLRESADYSLVSIELDTGRKNQIRVHMKDLGNPVVGDEKYGAKTDPFKRLGLHAHMLELTHPFTQKRLHFEAEIPGAFEALFRR